MGSEFEVCSWCGYVYVVNFPGLLDQPLCTSGPRCCMLRYYHGQGPWICGNCYWCGAYQWLWVPSRFLDERDIDHMWLRLHSTWIEVDSDDDLSLPDPRGFCQLCCHRYNACEGPLEPRNCIRNTTAKLDFIFRKQGFAENTFEHIAMYLHAWHVP